MPQTRVYVNPFDSTGNYTQFQEITKFVRKIGEVGVEGDSNDYQLGIYRNSAFSLEVNNREGNFSDVDQSRSLFKFTRSDSIVRVTYTLDVDGPICGFAICGDSFLSDEKTVFEGLLVDDASGARAKDEKVSFSVNGFETLFDRVAVGAAGELPFSSISNGDMVSSVLYKLLNQAPVTDLLTVSALNIVPGTDVALDDVSFLAGMVVSDAVNQMLLISNSILYIKDRTVYIVDRSATAANKITLYGQASRLGPENIYDVQNDKSGIARIYNYFTWKGSAVLSKDNASIARYGVRAKEIDFAGITNSSSQAMIMNALKAEFKNIKREFELVVPLSYDTLALNVKDKLNVDYPVPYFPPAEGVRLPICGIAICGVDRLPKGIWHLKIDPSINFKIIAFRHNLDPQKYTTTLKVRRV